MTSSDRPRRVLMVAFHFPPVRGSSGMHRTLAFSRYLKEDFGWEPTVLTANPRAYEQTSDDLLADIAPGVEVVRAFGLDTKRHLSLAGRYPSRLALPDRWMSWWFGATSAGKRILKEHRPDVIWSTYPIATAHWIARTLHRRSGVPWVADFRDSMTEEGYPANRTQWKAFRSLERQAVEEADRCVFTTSGTRQMYAGRYPQVPPSRWAVIANGFDARTFEDAERRAPRSRDQGLRLVHAGLLYRSERDPRQFFAAVAALRDAGEIRPGDLRIVLRASGDEEYHASHLASYGIEEFVSLEDSLPYRDALAEMLSADGLLLFQASNCNHQIPAKVYEYLRAGRPVLALTDPEGDTAGVLREAEVGAVAPLDSKEEIVRALRAFLADLREGSGSVLDAEAAERFSRRARAAELAQLLEAVCRCERTR